MQVGDVTHNADGHSSIEARFVVVLIGTLQQCQAIGPAWRIVIFRPKPLLIRVLKYLDQFKSLCGGLAVADPRQLVSGRAVKVVQMRPVVREVWPAKVFMATGVDDR